MIEENLSKIGFSPSEIKVYMHLLKIGSSYPNRISAETKINRTNVYEALDRLVSKGVVSFITRNKVKWFEARSPDSILSLLKEREEEFQATKNNLIDDIKSISSIAQDKKQLEANVFAGKKGLRIVFEEILEINKPIFILASQLQFKDAFGPYFELWHKERIEKKIAQKSIFPKKFKDKVEKRKLLEYKFVDDKFTSPTTTIICGNCCYFIQWSDEPIAIKIENKEIAKSHLNYFNIFWNS